MTVSTRLMLANYALNMHRDPSDRFGITYGCLGLMTWATFGNVSEEGEGRIVYQKDY